MAVEGPVEQLALGQLAECGGRLLADRLAGVGDRTRQQVVAVTQPIGLGGPAVDVAADPERVVEATQDRQHLRRERPEQGVVAAEQEPLRTCPARVGEHGLERRDVAVHVVDDRQRRH